LAGGFGEKVRAVSVGTDILQLDEFGRDELPDKMESDVHVFCSETILQYLAACQVNGSLVVYIDWDVGG
jgi:hypothetical protein